jgi:hypothetical protein
LVIVGVVAVMAVVGLIAVAVGGGTDRYFGQVVADDGASHTPQAEAAGAECRTAPGLCNVASNPYSSIPATSGPHWPNPTQWGVYGGDQTGFRALPARESQVIHNLEHAGIVVWYQPELAAEEDVARVTNWVLGQVRTDRWKVILSPWEGEDFGHAWAVTAWRHILYLDDDPLDGIRGFFDNHYGRRGPEPAGGPGRPADQ